MAKSGPASSLYAPGEVPRGSQARPRWPLAADSPPVRPVWTWVARGLIGGAALQSTAVDGGDGTSDLGGWPGPDPARGSEPSGPPGGAPGANYTP